MKNTEPELNLHPTANIFHIVLLGDIREENEGLRKDITRVNSLVDFAQKVELIATINQEPMIPVDGDEALFRVNALCAEQKVIAALKLRDGAIEGQGDEKWVIPIDSSPRTQINAVNQKFPPESYFSQFFVTFASKLGMFLCSGNGSNKKVILMYQHSTRMYIRSPA